jgi:transposase
MSARTKLRDDFDAGALRSLAKASKDAAQTRRLMALASIYEDGSHREAARIGGVTPQIVRDWVVRFNGRGGEGLIAGHAGGSAPKLTEDHRRALAKLVDDGPDPAVDGVVRWRLKDLVAWLHRTYGVTLDETTVSRVLKALGYRKLSARPRHHAQEDDAITAFKKVSRPRWRPSRPSSPARP